MPGAGVNRSRCEYGAIELLLKLAPKAGIKRQSATRCICDQTARSRSAAEEAKNRRTNLLSCWPRRHGYRQILSGLHQPQPKPARQWPAAGHLFAAPHSTKAVCCAQYSEGTDRGHRLRWAVEISPGRFLKGRRICGPAIFFFFFFYFCWARFFRSSSGGRLRFLPWRSGEPLAPPGKRTDRQRREIGCAFAAEAEAFEKAGFANPK